MKGHAAGQARAAEERRSRQALRDDPAFPAAERVLELRVAELEELSAHWQRIQRKAAAKALQAGAGRRSRQRRAIERATAAAVASAYYGLLATRAGQEAEKRWVGNKPSATAKAGHYLRISDVVNARAEARRTVHAEMRRAG